MKKAEKLFDQLFSQSPEKIALLDSKGKICWHNHAFKNLFPEHNLVNTLMTELVDEKVSWPPIHQEMRTTILGKKTHYSLTPVYKKSFLLNVKICEESDGLNDLSIFHHDIRSAFNAPIGFISIVLENLEKARSEKLELEENIEFLHYSYTKLLDMVNHSNSFLLTKRIRSGSHQANFIALDISKLLSQMKEDFDISFMKKKIQLVCKKLPMDFSQIRADQEALKIAIRNALQNAAEEILDSNFLEEEKRKIILSYGIANGMVSITIENYAKDAENKIKNIVKSQSGKSYGNGMGSEAIRSIIEFHQGSVKAEALENKIIVKLSFPA